VQVSLSAADGTGEFSIPISQDEYYSTIKEVTGLNVDSEKALFTTLKELAAVKSRYDKIASALSDVEEKGYGIVMPSPDELVLEEPKLVKQSGAYGVKMTAHADSIHMIKAGIKTELCPVVGTESQSEEVVKYLSDELAENPSGIWDYKLFGRSLFDLASDGLNTKIAHMPDESREKMGETLEKIINEGANGLICILL
jgi:stage IV sporulation protein A